MDQIISFINSHKNIALFIISASVLTISSIVVFLILRYRAKPPPTPPPNKPPSPPPTAPSLPGTITNVSVLVEKNTTFSD